LSSMSRSDTTNSRSIPLGTPKKHFKRFSRTGYYHNFLKTTARSGTRSLLDEDITAIRNPNALVRPDASQVTPSPPQVTHQESSAQSVMQDQALDTQVEVNEGLVTCSCAKKLQQEVHALLSKLHCNIVESHILHKSCTCTLLLLRFTQEASLLCYVEDTKGYKEDTETVALAEKGYTHKT
jgi:hypothetical protein